MVIDTSALLAIVLDEPERQSYPTKIHLDPKPPMAAANYVEAASFVLTRRGAAAAIPHRALLDEAGIEIADIDAAAAPAAVEAFRRFGGGRRAAGLNFGDGFACALASVMGEPLLYKGDDFAKTDIAAA